MYEVITCGSATVDVFAHTESELVTIRTANSSQSLIAYPSGSKILIKKLQFEVGGGGTNTAVAFARMGLKTGYIGCLGLDENANRIKRLLKEERVSFLGHSIKENTGYSVILDSIEHDRTILAHKGANDKLSDRRIRFTSLKPRLFYFSSMMGESFKTQCSVAKHAKKYGVPLAYNPSLYQAKQGMLILKPILDATKILICNKEEIVALAKIDDVVAAMTAVQALGVSTVVVTDGPNIVRCLDHKSMYVMTPQKVPVVEATGAGDAFAAGFCAAYLKNASVEDCLRWGLAQSQSVLGKVGAKAGLICASMIQKKVKTAHIRVSKVDA